MERTRRRRLAERLAAKIVKSRKDVVAVVLFGSVARGDDGPHSDVELAAVVRRGEWKAQRFVLDGILFDVYWSSAAGLRRHMLQPDGNATRLGFADGVALYDSRGWFARLQRDVRRLPHSFYRRSAEDALQSMYEYVCKARNARRRRDELNIVYATGVVGYEARVLAALLNRRHYRTENTMGNEWWRFPDLPRNFAGHVAPLLAARASPERRYDAAMALWRLCRAWAARRGVRLNVVRDLRDVRIPKTT